MIYLDYAATTPVDPQVQTRIMEVMAKYYGNPSATYQLGKASKSLLVQARAQMADLLLVKEQNLYFTSGATEAINWALRSQAHQARDLGWGNHIVTTAIEHSAVDKLLSELESEGFQVTRLQPDLDKGYTVDAFLEASTDQTIGWTSMAVNNETGYCLPIEALGQAAREEGYWFHVDSTQAIGYPEMRVLSASATSFTGSGHKFYAPKGVGFLVYQPWRPEMTLRPLLIGGGQERNQRSGTENLPYIAGIVEALRLAVENMEVSDRHYQNLSTYLYRALDQAGIEYQANGQFDRHNYRIHNIWFKGHLASQLLIHLDLAGIFVSAGSACSAGSVKPSRVLKAFYPNTEALWGESLRISFGHQTTTQELDLLVNKLHDFIKGV